jgi:hypothetical protein
MSGKANFGRDGPAVQELARTGFSCLEDASMLQVLKRSVLADWPAWTDRSRWGPGASAGPDVERAEAEVEEDPRAFARGLSSAVPLGILAWLILAGLAAIARWLVGFGSGGVSF